MLKKWQDEEGFVTVAELAVLNRLLNCGVDASLVAEAFAGYKEAWVCLPRHEKQGQAGEAHHNARLSPWLVEFIRQLRERGVAEEALAVMAGVSKRAIGAVCRFERWQQ